VFHLNQFKEMLNKLMKVTEIYESKLCLLVPDSAPENITYRNISSTEIELSFFPPSTPNGVIQTYTIYLKRSNGTEQRVVNTTLLMLRITGQYIMIWNLWQLQIVLRRDQQTGADQLFHWLDMILPVLI